MPATSTPVPAPAAIHWQSPAAFDDVIDLGLTELRVSAFLLGSEAEAVLPMSDLGAAPEGSQWAYAKFSFSSTCADVEPVFYFGMKVITPETYACAPMVDFAIADVTGRAYPASASLTADNKIWWLSNPQDTILDFTTDTGVGFATLVPLAAKLSRITLERVFFDSGGFDVMTMSSWDAMRPIVFAIPGAEDPAAFEPTLPVNEIGIDAALPAAIGDTLVTSTWQIRLVSIKEGAEAVAAFKALGLPQARPYDVTYLAELELTARGAYWQPYNLPHFTPIGEQADKALAFHYWTPVGQSVPDQTYYPGATLTVYLGQSLRADNRPTLISVDSMEEDYTYTKRFLIGAAPDRR